MDKKQVSELVELLEGWKEWLETAHVKPEEEIGKNNLLSQISDAIKKYKKSMD